MNLRHTKMVRLSVSDVEVSGMFFTQVGILRK